MPQLKESAAVRLIGRPLGGFHEGIDNALRNLRMGIDEGFTGNNAGIATEARIIALRRIDDIGRTVGSQIDQLRVAKSRINVLAGKRRNGGRAVQIHQLNVPLLQPVRFQNFDCCEMSVGATLQGNLAALQIFDFADAAILGDGKIERLACTACQQILGFQSCRTANQRRKIALIGKIKLIVCKAFVNRRSGALEKGPFDFDVGIVGEFFLQKFAGTSRGRGCALCKRPVIDTDRRIADMDGQRFLCVCRDRQDTGEGDAGGKT